jgi:glucose-1-phosphate adenylyltransferase
MILAGGKGERLMPLTRDRAKPAVPFGGIYRIIDFPLSNCINSGMRHILVLTQYKSYSLERHIREGWAILPRYLGEFIDTLAPQLRISEEFYQGTGDAFFQNLYHIRQFKPDFVLILSGDHVYKMDYRKMLMWHLDNGADVTISAVEIPKADSDRFGVMEVNEDYQIAAFHEKQANAPTMPASPEFCLGSMGVYIFSADVLEKALAEDAEDQSSAHDFGKNIIPKMIAGGKRVFGYKFVDENDKPSTYWRDIGTIDAYYDANMDLVQVSPVFNLYDKRWPIRTLQVQAPPPKFVFAQEYPGGRCGMALDSSVASGCIISGGRVQNSILSPFSRVHSYSRIEQSVIFERVEIGKGAKIRRAIIDKNVKIPEGFEIGYNLAEDAKRFTVSKGGVVVVPRDMVIS